MALELQLTTIFEIKSNIPEYLIKGNKNYKIVSNHLGFAGEVSDSNLSPVRHQKPAELPIWDEDTKLVRFGARDYDSETGRWTSKEPLGFGGARKFGTQVSVKGYTTNQQSCNFYVYADNDGVNYVDLDGYKKQRRYSQKQGIPGYSRVNDIVLYENGVSELTLAIRAAINFIQSNICNAIKNKKEYGTDVYPSESGAIHPSDSDSRVGTIDSLNTPTRESSILAVHLHIVDGKVYGENGTVTYYNSESFSKKDISGARLGNTPEVIGTVNGNVKVFIPAYNKYFFSEDDVYLNLGEQIDLSKCVCPIKNGNKGASCGK